MNELAVFGYGSLASPQSAAATLGREVEVIGNARLVGWRRRWSVVRDNLTSEKRFARARDGSLPARCVGLNIERRAGEPGANGLLLAVTGADLERLDLRERRYERTVVTGDVEPVAGQAPGMVVTYTARPENHAPQPPRDAILIAAYLRTVEAAFEDLGELDEFWASTDQPPVEVAEAVLVEDRIPAGNPREW